MINPKNISRISIFLLLLFVSCEKLPEIKDLLSSGNIHFEKGRYDQAIEDYSRVIDRLDSDNPNSINAHFNRGRVYFMKGQYDRAIEDFTVVIDNNPEDDQAHYNRKNAYTLKKYEGRHTKSKKTNPKVAQIYYNRGLIYLENDKHYDKAIRDFKTAIKLNPDDAKPYCLLGITHFKKRCYDKAITHFSKAIAAKPDYAEAYAGRGQSHMRLKEIEEAIPDFEKACKLGENCGCIMLGLIAKMEKGEETEAKAEAEAEKVEARVEEANVKAGAEVKIREVVDTKIPGCALPPIRFVIEGIKENAEGEVKEKEAVDTKVPGCTLPPIHIVIEVVKKKPAD